MSFAAVELAAVPLLLHWGRHWWFWADDWEFLATRTGGNAGDLFRAHYQHWTTLPVVAYRLLWFGFGLRSYVPYQLLVIAAHLGAAALLRVVMRRAGVRPWIATLAGLVFVFFGAGAENILIAFQITFVGSLGFGLVQLVLADHDGPIDRRDGLGLLAGFAGLMCSGVAIGMVIIVGVAVLLRRGWRIALLHTGPLAVAYFIWSRVSPKGVGGNAYRSQTPVQVIKFMAIGVGSVFGRLAQVPGLGFALAALLIAGATVMYRVERRRPIDSPDAIAQRRAARARLAVPVALLGGAVIFLLLTGVVRSGAPGPFANTIGVGPERARQSRYVYVIAAMALPALALAADAVIRRWRQLAIPVVALLVAGVPGNVHQLASYANLSSVDRQRFRTAVLEAPRLPLASRLPRVIAPAPPVMFAGLTLGWLVDSFPSGRIPSPGRLTTTQIATQTLHLALRPYSFPQPEARCRTLNGTGTVTIMKFRRVTLKSGYATIIYLPPTGGASLAQGFVPRTWVSFVDGLRLQITPLFGQPIVLCA